MEPRIELLTPKKLIGKHVKMCYANNQTSELWRSFMTRRKEITNNLNSDLYSLQVYDKSLDFRQFSPQTEFKKWALTEVSDFDSIPDGMEKYELEGGLYAVFDFKGTAADFPKVFQYILRIWLPNSEYELDNREHFELIGEKYKNNDPNSEEEIWIPIKSKS